MGALIILAVVLGSVVWILSASWGWHSSLPSERLIVVIRRTLSGLAEIAVDMLPDDELEAAERVLAGLSVLSLSNPATAALAKAPVDDEPVTRPAKRKRSRKGNATSSADGSSPRTSCVRALDRDRPLHHRAVKDMENLPPGDR